MDRQSQLTRAVYAAQKKGVDVNSAEFMDTTHYITLDAKGKGGIVQLINSNTRKLEGVTSFDADKLNKGRYLVIDGIRVLAENTKTDVASADWEDKLIAALKNSELVIFQGKNLVKIPVTDLHNANLATGNDDDFRTISTAPVIEPELPFEINWIFPNGKNVDSSVTAALVRIEFRCHEVFLK